MARSPPEIGARFVLERGERLELTFESGEFRIAHDPFPFHGAETPVQAVEQLQLALSLKDYDRLMAILDPNLREKLSAALQDLSDAIDDREHALFDVQDERATVTFPGGTVLHLRRVHDKWLVVEIP